MGPKQKPNQNHKQPVDYEEDYVPIKTLIEYGIDAETVKILRDAEIWNSLLIKNNKELLVAVKGLSEIKFDPICEAVDKIMASLTSQVQVFTQTLVIPQNMPRTRCMSEFVEACYSLDEMHETLSKKFGQPFKTTKNTYDYFLKGRKGSKAYKQLSLVRAAQRRAEKHAKSQRKQQLNVGKICEAVNKSESEQKVQAENQVQSNSEEKEQAESLLPIHDEAELPKPTEVQSNKQDRDQVQSSEHKKEAESLPNEIELPKPTGVQTNTKQKEQDGDQVQSNEHKEQAESLLPIQDEVEIPKPAEVQSNTAHNEQDGDHSSEYKEQSESLLPIQDEFELPTISTEVQSPGEQKEQARSESVLPVLTQIINSQKEILDAMTSQTKMMEALLDLQTEIATKDDLESLERNLGRRLESIGEDIALQVANGFLSTSSKSVNKSEKDVTSKVKGALSTLNTPIKDFVQSETRAAEAENVSHDLKGKMALLLIEGEYEKCFSIAVHNEDDNASLCWLLTKVHPDQLQEHEFQLSQLTLRQLLQRLVRLAACGLGTRVNYEWFKAVVNGIRSDPYIRLEDANKLAYILAYVSMLPINYNV